MAGEPLAGHITPDTVVLINSRNFSGSRTGDIVIHNEQFISRLKSAELGTTLFRPSEDEFWRYITDPHDGTEIGYMNMKRPIPDPDTRFESLAQDPLLAGIPTALRSEVNPASLVPTATRSCGPTEIECILVVPVNVFYFGPDPTNTACLSAITSPPPSPTPPQVTMDPSSVYVVYQPPQIFDGCKKWLVGVDGPPVTMSYQSEKLSSLEYRSDGPPATKAINFADLPCPPSDVADVYNSGAPYFPILVSTFGARFSPYSVGNSPVLAPDGCEVAAIRDPPVRAIRVGEISGPKDDSDTIV
ncbi:MAG: hypothetical protein Q9166_007505 [cf. Caloplaca sp. 2 TL-2023]